MLKAGVTQLEPIDCVLGLVKKQEEKGRSQKPEWRPPKQVGEGSHILGEYMDVTTWRNTSNMLVFAGRSQYKDMLRIANTKA